MKRQYLYVSLIIFLGACSPTKDNDNIPKGPLMPTAEVYILQTSSLGIQVESNGTLLPKEEVLLSTEIGGRIVGIYFQEGSLVNKNQLLFKLNDDELQARLNQVKARYDMESKNLLRLEYLIKSGGVAQQELDESKTKIQEFTAEISLINAQIEKTTIKAPWSGHIGLRNVSEGAVIAVGTPLATLRQLNPLKVVFNIPEQYGSYVQKNNLVQVFSENKFAPKVSGKVSAIEPGIDLASRSLSIQAIIPNDQQNLISGSSARVVLVLDSIKNAFVVPDKAIKPVLKGQEILVLKNGVVNPVSVQIGQREKNWVQVIGNLQLGDTILTSGIMQVKPNGKVEVIKVSHQL
jgi:membrane fusion protein (multidrug efflux system)